MRDKADKSNPNNRHSPNWKQSYRFQVYVTAQVKRRLAPLARQRIMSQTLAAEALTLSLFEAMRLVDEEDKEAHKGRAYGSGEIDHSILWVTPTDELFTKAAAFHVPPQLLLRAAAVKVGRKLREQEALERENAKLSEKYGTNGQSGPIEYSA